MARFINYFADCLNRRNFIIEIGRASLITMVASSIVLPMGCSKKMDDRIKHKKELVGYQQTCRPVIIKLLGEENYDRLCKSSLMEYDKFSAQLPLFKDDNNKSTFYASAPFMLSHYRALLGEFALDQKKALDVLREITNYKVRKKSENPSLLMKFIFPRVARYDFFRRLALKKFTYKGEKYGWATTFPPSDAYMAVDYVKCGLSDWFRDQGAPEIAPIACEGDLIWTELLTGLKFIRTKTIAGGDGLCDFRFVKKRV